MGLITNPIFHFPSLSPSLDVGKTVVRRALALTVVHAFSPWSAFDVIPETTQMCCDSEKET